MKLFFLYQHNVSAARAIATHAARVNGFAICSTGTTYRSKLLDRPNQKRDNVLFHCRKIFLIGKLRT
jgi:hypothetical protein